MGYRFGDPQHLLGVVLHLAAVGAAGALAARRWRGGAAAGILVVLAAAWAASSGLLLPSRVAPDQRAGLWAEYGAVLGGLAAGLLLIAPGRRRRASRPAA